MNKYLSQYSFCGYAAATGLPQQVVIQRRGVFLFLLFLTACSLLSCQPRFRSTSQTPTAEEIVIELPTVISTFTPTVRVQPKATKTITKTALPSFSISQTQTPNNSLATTTQDTSCPGAPRQQVRVGKLARVCTKEDKLLVREGPDRSATVIDALVPGEIIKVTNGPVCDDAWSYWEIETGMGLIGWVAEGGDEVDPYFICPEPNP